MKCSQLIEYNMRNIFIEKPYIKCGKETLFPDPYLNNENWAYLWINTVKLSTICFYCMLI